VQGVNTRLLSQKLAILLCLVYLISITSKSLKDFNLKTFLSKVGSSLVIILKLLILLLIFLVYPRTLIVAFIIIFYLLLLLIVLGTT
jgi:L-asparagine transporter-like permease